VICAPGSSGVKQPASILPEPFATRTLRFAGKGMSAASEGMKGGNGRRAGPGTSSEWSAHRRKRTRMRAATMVGLGARSGRARRQERK
jgi:hypothetical protein